MQIFYDAQGQLTPQSKVGSKKFKLIRAFMVGLFICKNEEDPSKKSGHNISPIISLWGFFQTLKGS